MCFDVFAFPALNLCLTNVVEILIDEVIKRLFS